MKRFLIISILTIFGLANASLAAGNAYLEFSPDNKSVEQGESFNVNIVANPNNETIDTVRAIVSYPQDKLEVIHFALNDLFPNTAPGNYIDNENGKMSQGGTIFGGSTNKSGIFGTITFKALQEGKTNISFDGSSKMISAGDEKINLNSLSQATIDITEAEEISPNQVVVNSNSHENDEKWYNIKNVQVSWEMSPGSRSDILTYYYDFDNDPETDPKTSQNINDTNLEFTNIDDGIWYFHIKTQFSDQTYSDTTHYRVMIDTDNPEKILPIFEKEVIRADEEAELKFGTLDQTSGIDFYEVAIDGGSFNRAKSPFNFKNLKPGEHNVIIRAVDKAGNVTSNNTKVVVLPKPETVPTPTPLWVKIIIFLLILVIIFTIYKFIKIKNRK